MTSTAHAKAGQSCPKYEAAIKAHGLPKEFSYIAWRESRCNPRSVSAIRSTGRPDVGFLQIQGSWQTVTRNVCHLKRNENVVKALTVLDCNLRVAKYLYDIGGLSPWKATSHR